MAPYFIANTTVATSLLTKITFSTSVFAQKTSIL